jgi:plasmid stabilization system protein ParE
MAERTKIIWMQRAEEDFRNILSNLYDISPTYAQDWTEEVSQKTERLLQHPLLGRVVPEKELSFFREIFVGRYRIMYTVQCLKRFT